MNAKRRRASVAAVLGGALAALAFMVGCGPFEDDTASADLGAEGEPVTLTVGYQPYYTEAWSGLVMRDQEFWREHLPEGSEVNFQVGLQGSIITSQMLAGKQQIGYVGDMPAIVAASKRATRDLRIVATLGTSPGEMCGVFLVRPDAPKFDSQEEALKWLDGKTVATPHGSCADRIAQGTFEKLGVEPAKYLNQSIEVITTNFESGRIDAAIIWEPTAARLVNEGLARRVASGVLPGEPDAAFLLMSKELIDERPDIARAWLEAELEAQAYLADPKNADAIVAAALEQTEGFTERDLFDALYRKWPAEVGGSKDGVRLELPFAITPEGERLIANSASFLHQIDAISSPELPEGAVFGSLAQEALDASGGGGRRVIKAQARRGG
jgi:NitT/TauT family transport system substrate-binding protein